MIQDVQAQPVVLVTGGARRIGAAICSELHDRGWRVLVHYRRSASEAENLVARFNNQRADSACALAADLNDPAAVRQLAGDAIAHWGCIDALVNNASSFYPTPLPGTTEDQWQELMNSNLQAPFFLGQALAPALAQANGTIVNLVDIHAERPMRHHAVYSIAKAGLQMLTRTLALELAPHVRVNGIAPGAILWPEGHEEGSAPQDEILHRIPLARAGEPADIARTARFLITEAPYITGQVIAVDGGRSLNM